MNWNLFSCHVCKIPLEDLEHLFSLKMMLSVLRASISHQNTDPPVPLQLYSRMSSRKSSPHLKDTSTANSFEPRGNHPASTTHPRGTKGYEIKSLWSLIQPGLQGIPRNLLLELKYLTRGRRRIRQVFDIVILVWVRKDSQLLNYKRRSLLQPESFASPTETGFGVGWGPLIPSHPWRR